MLLVKIIDVYVKVLMDEFLGKEYFDVKMFFDVIFQSIKVESKGDNKYDVEGNLIIKGIIKLVVLYVVLNKQDMYLMVKKEVIGFDVIGVIKCLDFKFDKYVLVVSDNVIIMLFMEVYVK